MQTGFRKFIEFYQDERYNELLYGTIYYVPGTNCECLNAYVKHNATRIATLINKETNNWITCNISYLDADNTFFAPQENATFYSAMLPTKDTIEQGYSFLVAILENCEAEHLEKAFVRFFQTLQKMFKEVLENGSYKNIHYIFPEILSSGGDDEVCCVKLANGAAGIHGLPPNGHKRTPRAQLSKLKITERKDRYRILLTELEDTELPLNPQEKALYVFFLKHKEGLRKEELINYEGEFSLIFELLSNRDDLEWQKESVKKLLLDGGVDLKSSLRAKLTSINSKVKNAINNDNISWNYEIEERRDRRYGIYLERRLIDMQSIDAELINLTKVRGK
ncbi:MAG: hypothetical protein IJQ97_00910 [Paludibacteraceae bacterium]|nr:hypothetical protein [Paludibacteraceae bacterium]